MLFCFPYLKFQLSAFALWGNTLQSICDILVTVIVQNLMPHVFTYLKFGTKIIGEIKGKTENKSKFNEAQLYLNEKENQTIFPTVNTDDTVSFSTLSEKTTRS